MSEEKINEIIDERLADFIKSDRLVFAKLLQILDCRNLQLGKTTGTKIGTETTQKIGFLSATPVVQQSHIADPTGQATDKDDEARTAINSILVLLETFGFKATS